MMYTRRS